MSFVSQILNFSRIAVLGLAVSGCVISPLPYGRGHGHWNRGGHHYSEQGSVSPPPPPLHDGQYHRGR